MKIAVVTSVFGNIDNQKPFAWQDLPDGWEVTRFFINDSTSPFPIPNLPNRLRAKFFKTQFHRINSDFDAIIWIDGNIEIKSPIFVRKMVEAINGKGIAIQKHHERDSIEQEIDFIVRSGNPYLTIRYGEQPLQQEYEYYLSQGMPPTQELYSCNIFIFSTELAGFFMDEWWRLCLMWSWFDQSAFSYLAYKYSRILSVVDLGNVWNNEYYTLHPHDNWSQ